MGQYHKTVNLDKKEFLNPHALGVGLKQWEQLVNDPGIGTALQILVFSSNSRGGGDIGDDGNEVIGRWAGDRIITVGDYQNDNDVGFRRKDGRPSLVYDRCYPENEMTGNLKIFTDITDLVKPIIEQTFDGKYEKNNWGSSSFRFNKNGFFGDRCPEETA